jgi:uncharacterized protein with HEPN domain
MPRDPQKYLYDMLDSCRFLVQFTAGRGPDDLRTDGPFRAAIEREWQIISLALIALSKIAPQVAEAFPERDGIVRFRHILVHGYDSLDYDVVWSIVHNKLPSLEADIERTLKSLDKSG